MYTIYYQLTYHLHTCLQGMLMTLFVSTPRQTVNQNQNPR